MPKDVTVYTRPTCAPCRSLKMYLNHKGISFNEINIDETPDARIRMAELGGGAMVPFTVITSQDDSRKTISGFNLRSLSSAIS